ncbi:MAG: hypothetical protein KGY46_10230, partial [Anaerolineales bacterium]|nr:hypothetical protein [Anaerolineales bacterium]
MPECYLSFVVGLSFIFSLGLILVNDWRGMMGLLFLQYGGVTVLILESWSLERALIKAVAGWFAVAVLSVSYLSS